MAALGLALPGTSAWAAGPTDGQVKLVTEACPGVDAARLGELVALEFSTFAADRRQYPSVVVLVCDGQRVAITATNTQTGRQSLSEVPARDPAEPALLRLLAISISELVATSEAPPAQRPPPPSEPTPKTESGRRFRVTAAGSLRRVARPATWLPGFTLGAEVAFANHFALAIEGRGEAGSATPRLTTVGCQAVGASLGLLAGTDKGGWRVEVGLGIEGGLVKLTGHDTASGAKESSLSEPWSGPFGRLRLLRMLGRRAFVLGRLDGGWIMQGVVGAASNGSPLVEFRGGWAGMTIGVGLVL